jgi:hypothetical protein
MLTKNKFGIGEKGYLNASFCYDGQDLIKQIIKNKIIFFDFSSFSKTISY